MKWRDSAEGRDALMWMLRRAQQRKAAGESRVGVNYLSDALRDERKVRHCNTWRPWMANDLLVLDRSLVDVIQRKMRKKPEPEPIHDDL